MKLDIRFHPLYMVVSMINLLKGAFIPFILLFIIQLGNQSFIWVAGRYVFVAYIVFSLIRIFLIWRTTTYRLEEDAFILKKGIFSKTRTTITYGRIQNIQRSTSAFHKLLGITSLQFSTAAASSASSVIDIEAISRQDADELEDFVKDLIGDLQSEELTESELEENAVKQKPTQKVYFEATKKQMIKASFTSLRIFIIFPILAFIINQGSELFQMEDVFEEWFELIIASYILLAIVIIILLLLSVVIGMLTTYLQYGRFIISSDEERIYIHRGILSEKSFTIQKEKVQGLKIKQNILKRLLKLSEIRLVNIAQQDEEEASEATNSLYPFLENKEGKRLIKQILPRYFVEPSLQKLPKVAFYTHLIQVPYLFILAVIAYFIWSFSFWWAIAVLVYTMIARILQYLFTRYALAGEFIVYKTGVWSVEAYVTRRNNVMEVSVTQNIFQRLFSLATIQISMRAKPAETISMEHVPIAFAHDVLHWYEQRKVQLVEE